MRKITTFLKRLIASFIFLVTVNCCIAQIDSTTTTTNKSFTLTTEIMVGPTVSLAYGDYATYQKSFGNVSYPDAKINSRLLPRIFGSVGGQVRLNFPTQPIIKNFDFSVGIYYYRRGFSNNYKSKFSAEGFTLNDKTTFKEQYNLNYIAIPFKVRYNTNKWFYEMGFSIDQLVFARQKHILKRSTTGSDAYDGGYRKTERTTSAFADFLLKNRVRGYDLAIGNSLSEKLDFRLNFHFARSPFDTVEQLKNLVTHFELLFKL